MIRINDKTYIVAHDHRALIVRVDSEPENLQHPATADVLADVTDELIRVLLGLVKVGQTLSMVDQNGNCILLHCEDGGHIRHKLNS